LNTSRPSSFRNAAAAITGAVLLGSGGVAAAGPPPSINVQIATPGFYTSFATGPQWVPYYAYQPVPVVPVYAPVYVPRYYTYGPPPVYWEPRHVDYPRSDWDRDWHDDDRDHGHHDNRPRHHQDNGWHGGRKHHDR
jgi:hypothetical protein